MAVIKYYNNDTGAFTEDPEGQLVGIEWTDAGGNLIRAILFFMDFSTLIGGNEITFMYQAEVLPETQEVWLLRDRKSFVISNNVMVDPNDPPITSLKRRVSLFDPVTPNPDLVGQLDYFVDIYLKGGKYPPGLLSPMYVWLAEVIADLEGQIIA